MFCGVLAVLAEAGLPAAFLPVRRATNVEPAVAVRQEESSTWPNGWASGTNPGASKGPVPEDCMKIGVIGAGNVGGALGKLWAAKGHAVVFGVRDPKSAKSRELEKASGIRVASVKDAAAASEVVALAIPWAGAEDTIRSAGDLTGKVVIDCINPLKPDLSGLQVGCDNSAGEEVARWAQGARVVKAFNTIGAGNFGNPKFGSQSASMFICGDDAGAKKVVGGLAAEMGFDVVDTGPLTTSRWLEALAVLWIHLAVKEGLGPTGHAFQLLRR